MTGFVSVDFPFVLAVSEVAGELEGGGLAGLFIVEDFTSGVAVTLVAGIPGTAYVAGFSVAGASPDESSIVRICRCMDKIKA